MSEEENDEPPKIIVDEDWKQKVEAEKQALEDEIAQKAKELAGEAEEAGQGDAPEGDAPEGADYDLPPASFPGLLQEFSTRALVSLGMVPNPFTQEAQVDLKAAAYSIDMLAVLQEKTEGNLEEQEATYLAQLTAQLREAFVKISAGAAGAEEAGAAGAEEAGAAGAEEAGGDDDAGDPGEAADDAEGGG